MYVKQFKHPKKICIQPFLKELFLFWSENSQEDNSGVLLLNILQHHCDPLSAGVLNNYEEEKTENHKTNAKRGEWNIFSFICYDLSHNKDKLVDK